MFTRLKASAATLVIGGAAFAGMAVLVPATAQAACTSFYIVDNGNSGGTVVGHNYCSAGTFRPDIAWAPDPACAYMATNGTASWHIAPYEKGSVRSIVRC